MVLGLVLIVRAGVRDRGVISDHIEFGRRVLQGLDLYAPYLDEGPLHPPYPPGFGLLTAPFSLMPERVARFGWAALQVAALGAIGAFLARTLRELWPQLRPRTHTALALTALVCARYVLRDTHGGGGNLINLALALLAVDLAQRRREVLAGVLLGFSLATKPTHVLFVPLLLVLARPRAAWTALVATAAFTGLALWLLGQGIAPFERWLAGTWAYARMTDVFATPEYGFPPFTWMNQCLRCALHRYLGEVPAEYAAEVPYFFAGIGLGSGVVAAIASAAGLAVLALTARAAWPRRESPAARAWLIAAVLAASLLLSPISWKAHHIALLPVVFLLVCRALAGTRWVWWLLAAYLPLCVLGEELVGKDFKQLQQSLYLVTAGTLALWAVAVVAARRAAVDSPADVA